MKYHGKDIDVLFQDNGTEKFLGIYFYNSIYTFKNL